MQAGHRPDLPMSGHPPSECSCIQLNAHSSPVCYVPVRAGLDLAGFRRELIRGLRGTRTDLVPNGSLG